MFINIDVVKELCHDTVKEYNLEHNSDLNLDHLIMLTSGNVCEIVAKLGTKMTDEELIYSLVSSIVSLSLENLILQYKLNT